MTRQDNAGTIVTPRLEIVSATPVILNAELASREQFSQALGAAVPPAWPPALYDESAIEYTLARVQESPADTAWWGRYVVLVDGSPRTVIGAAGFKGPPDAAGIVELGYGVVRDFQKKGYATEAVAGMIEWAFENPAVEAVRAQTLPNLVASIGVMRRNGLEFLKNDVDEGMQTVVYELTRTVWTQSRG